MAMKAVLMIAAGSALGGVARYGLQLLMFKLYSGPFPLGIFLVNLTGCFLIGLFFSLAERAGAISQEAKLFLITGFCGGFTTFSTFSVDGLFLFRRGEIFYFILYTAGSVIAGLLMTWLGMQVIKPV